MKLIPEAKRAWRMFSVQSMAWGTAMLAGWPAIPADLQTTISPVWYMRVVAFLLVAGILGRLIDQPTVKAPEPPQ
jgi:hypothetical protein